MEVELKCKGVWEEMVEDIIQEFICPMRKTCYRYHSRHTGELRAYFDVVPFSFNMQTCDYYIKWR